MADADGVRRIFLVFFFFFLAVPFVSSLSFNLSTIGPADNKRNIITTGDAYINSQGIQLTPDEEAQPFQIGRATYVKPFHLWDNASSERADFSTHFTFVIDSFGNSTFGDGMAFFLVPVNSDIPLHSFGLSLGLTTAQSVVNSSANQFVAVEFDTFVNQPWDPKMTHVGININSMNSVVTTPWSNDTSWLGKLCEALIDYDSKAKLLSIVFTSFSSHRTTRGHLNYTIDLHGLLPEWVNFGFSAATGIYLEKNSVKSWAFNSSLQDAVNGAAPAALPSPGPATVDSNTQKEKTKKDKRGLFIGLSAGLSVFICVLGVVIGCILWIRKKKNRMGEECGNNDGVYFDSAMDNDFEKGNGPRKFSYNELFISTNGFAEEAKLGEGGFGSVYRGFSKQLNSYIAVKRVSKESKQGKKEYASEVKTISRLRHRNLVQLIGWCHEKRELLLVYEFMSNGSLDLHLFQGKSLLSWTVRYGTAQGLASALFYLHEGWEQCVVHRDIKSSNVMIDSNFNAKLGDFGLARLMDHEQGFQTTTLAGTLGYMAPECVITGKASKETDVFSFGIVALEIACGRKPIDGSFQEEKVRMVEWVWELYGEGKVLDAVDPRLNSDFDDGQMEKLMVVGLWCAHPIHSQRPSIRQAFHVLNFEAPLPTLPSRMPMSTYITSFTDTPSSFNVSEDR